MIEMILSHWATYLLLGWATLCVVGNLLPHKKSARPTVVAQSSPRRAGRATTTESLEDDFELAHRE